MKKGLILGRFQPFHLGHLALIKKIISDKLKPLICIGSSQKERSEENPFTKIERKKMIEAALESLDCNYEIYEIPDINNYDLYVSHLKNLVPSFDIVYSGNSLVNRLFTEAGHNVTVPDMVNREIWKGSSIRQAILKGDDWKMDVPPSVADIITDIDLGKLA
jgi:nicotinamide-nucleotide adenylyltransferase